MYRRNGRIRPLSLSLVVLTALGPALAAAQTRMSVEDRLSRLERQLDSNTLLDLLDRVDRLSREVRELRGEIEQQSDAVADLNRRQKEIFLDLDRRLKRAEGGAGTPVDAGARPAAGAGPAAPPAGAAAAVAPPPGATPGSRPGAPATGSPAAAAQPPGAPGTVPAAGSGAAAGPPTGPASSASDPLKEQNQYQQAFSLLKEGRYDQATKAFGSFLKSDNAQYWLGESHYVNRQFPPAMAEFNKLVQAYPDSAKVSHAKLKIGLIYAETGEVEKARKALEEVATRYPNTPQARLARERLDRIKSEGR